MDLEKIREDISVDQLNSLLSKLTSNGLHIFQVQSLPIYHIESDLEGKNPLFSFLGYIQLDSEKNYIS